MHKLDRNMNSSEEDEARQEQLREFLKQYKLDQYAAVLIEEGFDRLLSVSCQQINKLLLIYRTLIFLAPFLFS